ncbi:Cell death regulator Aven [Pteropus alecto]|uniref:Cell death regulator Aven n=1 Tax=Pteropus alecto TaxID=9402 RepID=L5K488_PTEAL|nr:Cell death regulator Aven [Pteropus alecto]
MGLKSGMSLPPPFSPPNLATFFLFIWSVFCPICILSPPVFLQSIVLQRSFFSQLLFRVHRAQISSAPSVFSVHLCSPAIAMHKTPRFQLLFSMGLPNWKVSSEYLLFILGCSGLSNALMLPSASSPGVGAMQVEDDSDAETYGEENEEQGNYSKRKIVSNWDRYQDTEKEVDNESGESQRGTDFSVLLSSAGDSFSQFRFAEEKEWDGEASCPKQNSAFYVNCESLVQALQELPLSLRLNVAAELVQTALPLELPQVKPKRNDEGKGLGMQLKGALGLGGKGSVSELKSAAAGCPLYLGKDSPRPGPSTGSQKPTAPLQSAADHLEEELDLLLNLDAPVKAGANILPDQTPQDLESQKDEEVAQEEKVLAKPAVTEEKNMESEQPSTSKNVTEEELEDWLDSMIS